MKIIGFSILFFVAMTLSGASFAQTICKGNIFTKIDDGSFGLQRVQFMPSQSLQKKLNSTSTKVNFNFDRKSDEWILYFYVAPEDSHFLTRNTVNDFNFRESGFNRESFVKFKDQSIIGYKLFCRM